MDFITENIASIVLIIVTSTIVIIAISARRKEKAEEEKLQHLDEIVISISQGWFGVIFLPFGKLKSSRITERIQRCKKLGYEVVSTEWIVNRFLLILSRQTVFLFLRKKNDQGMINIQTSFNSLLEIQQETLKVLNELKELLRKN